VKSSFPNPAHFLLTCANSMLSFMNLKSQLVHFPFRVQSTWSFASSTSNLPPIEKNFCLNLPISLSFSSYTSTVDRNSAMPLFIVISFSPAAVFISMLNGVILL